VVLPPITSLRINSSTIVTVARGGEYSFDLILNEGAVDFNIVWTLDEPSFGFVDEAGKVIIYGRIGNVRLTATDPVGG